jgi:hypothetical protein
MTKLLFRIANQQGKAQFNRDDIEFMCKLDFKDVTFAQLKAMSEGIGIKKLFRLWSENKYHLPDQSSKLRKELTPNHIIRIILAEHEMLSCFMADLVDANNEIQVLTSANSSTSEIRKLAHITSHLVSAEQHREREEQVVYPEFSKHGYSGLMKIVDQQHVKINNLHFELNELTWQIDKIDFDDFKNKLKNIILELVPAMRLHLFLEGNIILPLAMEVIPDEKKWKRMKKVCDDIGYCGYDS